MKIAVVTDSNSGITQAQAKEMGITVLPMPFMIDGETYYEDITLTQEQFYQRLKDNSDISTSQPTPDSIMKLWDELLKEYDQIVLSRQHHCSRAGSGKSGGHRDVDDLIILF